MASRLSDHDYDDAALADVDVDELIVEVQNRPALWDKTSIKYSDRIFKSKMWDEVYEKVIENWNDLAPEKKYKLGAQVLKKWRNIKDSFAKELSIQRKMASGQGPRRKKRQYVHFQALSFLTSQYTTENTTENTERESTYVIKVENENNEENSDDPLSGFNTDRTDSNSLENKIQVMKKKIVPKKFFPRKIARGTGPVLPIKREKKTYDEDISFAEMLVPLLKKLTEDQKHYAKVEILNVMNAAKRYEVEFE